MNRWFARALWSILFLPLFALAFPITLTPGTYTFDWDFTTGVAPPPPYTLGVGVRLIIDPATLSGDGETDAGTLAFYTGPHGTGTASACSSWDDNGFGSGCPAPDSDGFFPRCSP